MNVLFVSNDQKLFDPQSAVRARMREYAKLIGTLHIISRGAADDVTREDLGQGATLALHGVSGSRINALWKMRRAVHEIILQEKIDLVSAQDPFEYGWIAAHAVRGTNAKLHVQVHTDFLSPWFTRGFSRSAFLNRIRVFLADRVLPKAVGVRVVSIRVRNRIIARYGTRVPTPSVLPIPLVVPSDTQSVPFPANHFDFKILTVGRLEEEKRLQDLLRALTGVHSRYPKSGLFIAGEGRLKANLEKLAEELGVRDRVVFLGYRTDLFGLMKSADLLVHTSAYEGYSLTLLEAALAGVPIVTTSVGLVGEVLKKDEDVRLIPIANPIALAHEIVNLIENPAKRTALAAHAKETVEKFMTHVETSAAVIARDLAVACASPDKRLLITTQVVDLNDAGLGFMHTWIEKLAPHYKTIEVICLFKGECVLPANVRVHSLGKEKGKRSSFIYSLRFIGLAWKLRNSCDAVFVHMNQEYILLAGWLWKLCGKRIYMWRNHYAGSFATNVAIAFCTNVFCTSRYSYIARFKRNKFMPVGVDLERFNPSTAIQAKPKSILFFHRISPSKRPDMFLDALGALLAKGISFIGSVYGSPKQEDVAYYESLKARAESLGLHDRVRFHAGVPNIQAPDVFRAHQIYVNCSPSGMYDKMIFEAAACGCLVLSSSKDFAELAGADTYFSSETELEERLAVALSKPQDPGRVPDYIGENSLAALITKLSRMVS